jgi:hypothetical protein
LTAWERGWRSGVRVGSIQGGGIAHGSLSIIRMVQIPAWTAVWWWPQSRARLQVPWCYYLTVPAFKRRRLRMLAATLTPLESSSEAPKPTRPVTAPPSPSRDPPGDGRRCGDLVRHPCRAAGAALVADTRTRLSTRRHRTRSVT